MHGHTGRLPQVFLSFQLESVEANHKFTVGCSCRTYSRLQRSSCQQKTCNLHMRFKSIEHPGIEGIKNFLGKEEVTLSPWASPALYCTHRVTNSVPVAQFALIHFPERQSAVA